MFAYPFLMRQIAALTRDSIRNPNLKHVAVDQINPPDIINCLVGASAD